MSPSIFDDGEKLREGFVNVYRSEYRDDVLYAMMRRDRESAIFFESNLRPVQYRIHVIPKSTTGV